MGYWMREGGSELSAIGFLSWVGLAYTLKFLWAPIIDKTDVPLLGPLGPSPRLDAAVAAVRRGRAGGHGHRAAGRRPGGVRRAGADGRVRLGDPGHRDRCLAHRDRRQHRGTRPADVRHADRLSQRAAGHRCADPDPGHLHRLGAVLLGDGAADGRRALPRCCSRANPPHRDRPGSPGTCRCGRAPGCSMPSSVPSWRSSVPTASGRC
jgi:hypothetical protein